MNKPNTNVGANPRFTAHPPAGRQMPKDWMRNAPAVGAAADSAYLQRLENAWKPVDRPTSGILAKDARLSPPSWPDILGQK